MHASLNIFALTLTFDFDGKLWRTVFVAALALIVFALVSYHSTLQAHRPRVRLVLIALRGVSLLLVACALSGLHVGYDIVAAARVLLYQQTNRAGIDAVGVSANDVSRGSNVDDEMLRETADALAGKNIERVILDRINDVAEMKRAGDFSAAVLLTNGAMTAEEASRVVHQTSAAANGAPVYVVGDFDFSQGGRVALQSAVSVSGSVWRGVPVAVRCVVHGRGMSGRESLVTITDDTEAIRASTKVRWTTSDEWQTVVLRVTPKVSGWTNFAAHVEAAGGGNNGEDTATLVRSFALYAEEHRVRVLFFEGEPTWEAKFIRRALTESGLFDTDYFAQVSRAAAVGIAKDRKNKKAADSEDAAQTKSGGVGEEQRAAEDVGGVPSKDGAEKDAPEAKLHEALSSAARLNAYDCVIVGATPNVLLSVAETARLRDWVERRGGGLVVLGGNSFAGSIAAPNGKLYSLLPAGIDSRSLASELQQRALGVPLEADEMRGGVALTPTETGAGGALAGYRDAREAAETARAVHGNAAANRVLLSGEGFRLSALRAGAFALATSGTAGADGTSDTGAPLIAAMRNGAGRTLLFAPADSWRIRTSAAASSTMQNETGDAFAALWQGLLLWSAMGARAPVEMALSVDSPSAGSEVAAELRVRDVSFNALKIEKMNAHLQRISEGVEENKSGEENSADTTNEIMETIQVAFAPDSEDASLWRAHFKAPARGRFVLEADYTAAGGKKGNASKLFITVATPNLEAGAASDALNRAARETSGEVFNRTQMRSLAAKLVALPRHDKKAQRVWELRTWWPLAIIVSLLLATEWFLRRWWQVD